MRIGFIVPPGRQNVRPFRSQPLNILYLLTILEKEFGWNPQLIDLRGIYIDDVVYHIPENDVYFYSIGSQDFPDIKRIVKELREIYPRAKHIAGGPHIDIFKEKNLEVFDTISMGEGEESIKRIVYDLLKKRLNKIYLQQEEIDLNAYPYPSREFLPYSAAAERNVLTTKHQHILGTDVVFSRGCPFNCYFCCNLTRGKIRVRSPKNIYDEIMYLKRELNIEGIVIKDDQSIHTNESIAKPTLEAITRTNVLWRGQSRANGISTDMVKLAKESGCLEIAVGIESVSQRVIEIINKKIDLEKAKEYIASLKREGIDIKLLLILGLPGEPKDIADRTIDFIKEVEPTNALLSLLCPMPGSEIYENPKKFGIKINYEKEFDEYKFLYGRFDKDEKPKPIFEYEEITPFGEGKTTQELIDNLIKVQTFLRENKINF
jgi:anaerobic magnesium-protoporphyrin IX monomethyl ester cyclase